jgi:hypothetical protein
MIKYLTSKCEAPSSKPSAGEKKKKPPRVALGHPWPEPGTVWQEPKATRGVVLPMAHQEGRDQARAQEGGCGPSRLHTAGEPLTCEHVVILIHAVQRQPFVQLMELLGIQHMTLPVGIACRESRRRRPMI